MATLISLDGGEVIILLQKTKCSFLTPLQNVLSSLFSQTTFKVTFWVCRVPTSFSAKIGHGSTYMPMCIPLGTTFLMDSVFLQTESVEIVFLVGSENDIVKCSATLLKHTHCGRTFQSDILGTSCEGLSCLQF